jgi:hypothetical protein
MCFVSVLCVSFQINDHGGRRGNTAQALDRRWHPVALSEALDVIHQAMCPTLYCRIRVVIKIASNLPAFFFVVDFVVTNNLR